MEQIDNIVVDVVVVALEAFSLGGGGRTKLPPANGSTANSGGATNSPGRRGDRREGIGGMK